MQELGKILEEIDREIEERRKAPEISDVDICYGLNRAKDIIRKHMNDGWISVEDRLPENENEEKYDTCLVTLENGDVCLGVYRTDDRKWYVRMSEGEIYYNNNHVVTAWQPLPEPYRPERSEE